MEEEKMKSDVEINTEKVNQLLENIFSYIFKFKEESVSEKKKIVVKLTALTSSTISILVEGTEFIIENDESCFDKSSYNILIKYFNDRFELLTEEQIKKLIERSEKHLNLEELVSLLQNLDLQKLKLSVLEYLSKQEGLSKEFKDSADFIIALSKFFNALPEIPDSIREIKKLNLEKINFESLTEEETKIAAELQNLDPTDAKLKIEEKDTDFIKFIKLHKQLQKDTQSLAEKGISYTELEEKEEIKVEGDGINTEYLEGKFNGELTQERYRDKYELVKELFAVLNKYKLEERPEQIKKIADRLVIDGKKLENYFQLANLDAIKPELESAKETIELPKFEGQKIEEDGKLKLIDDVISEFKLIDKEKDDEGFSKKAYEAITAINRHYEETAKSWSTEELDKWSKDLKERKLGSSDEDVCRAIAIMERANELATGGHRLRDTQKLAIWNFMQTKGDKGHISQINTGEGKTTIVAFVQALKVMQGHKGHVITSNEVLAADGVKSKKTFYNLLNISVSHNNHDENYTEGPRQCYASDIVYGSISNFQFDWLKDDFERLNTLGAVKKEGKIDFDNIWVMMDEIDSLLIDQGGNIAKLSGPFPGMNCLKYIYINIWAELQKAEDEVTQQMTDCLRSKAEEANSAISREEDPEKRGQFEEKYHQEYEELQDKQQQRFLDAIKDKIKANKDKLIPKQLIAKHLHEYVETSLDRWIEYAFTAKYHYREDVEYKIVKGKNGEEIIIPVDNQNTGVSMKNTILSQGLHQFLQIKHNLALTYESLTSSYVSNLGYIFKYGNKLLGVTGTLGSDAERDLLGESFNLSFSIVPTYKPKIFDQFSGEVLEDEQFINGIATAALAQVENRAILIVCSSIDDAKEIREEIKREAEAAGIEARVKLYTDESEAHVTEQTVNVGDIIIATNIGGRGTDLKTEAELESNGGLHVIIGFLPSNKRVEDQAFGRTSRQGNNGSGQLIIRESEVELVGEGGILESKITEEKADEQDASELSVSYFDMILNRRDVLENERIANLRENKINEIKFKDFLFEYFSKLYGEFKDKQTSKKNNDDQKWIYALKDLKEKWAFWLEKQDYTVERIKALMEANSEADLKEISKQQFEIFTKEAQEIIATESGEIKHNPFYSISLAEFYLENLGKENRAKARRELENALAISGNPELLYSAYVKLFEVEMESGEQILQRFKEAVGKIFFIPLDKKNDAYKKEALSYLKKAEAALTAEFDYLYEMMQGSKPNEEEKRVESDEKVESKEVKKTKESILSLALSSSLQTDYWYTDNDMGKLGKQLIKEKLGEASIAKQFNGCLSDDQINPYLEGLTLEDNKPVFICYNIGGSAIDSTKKGMHWVAIALIKSGEKIKVLYKDSLGHEESAGVLKKSIIDIRQKFLEHYASSMTEGDFIVHPAKEQEDGSSCGPMVINNLEKMIDEFKAKGAAPLIDGFNALEFTKQKEIAKIRQTHAEFLGLKDTTRPNYFLKHLQGTFNILNTNLEHIKSLRKQLEVIVNLEELLVKYKEDKLTKSDFLAKLEEDKILEQLKEVNLLGIKVEDVENLKEELGKPTEDETKIQNLINKLLKELSKGVIIGTKIPRYLANLDPEVEHEKKLKESITKSEVDEFEYIGMSSVFGLQKVNNAEQTVIDGAQSQIAIGMGLLLATIPFPFLLPVNGPLAGAAISEGITDIVMELINQGNKDFSWKEYAKSKAISYGITIATMGIGAIASSTKILSKAMNACRNLATKLRAVEGPFAKVCKFAANQLDKLANYLEFAITKIEFVKKGAEEQNKILAGFHEKSSSLEKAGKVKESQACLKQLQQLTKLQKTSSIAISHTQKLMHVVKGASFGAIKGVAVSIAMEKIVTASLAEIMKGLKPKLHEKVISIVREKVNTNKAKLQNYSEEEIKEFIAQLFETTIAEDISDVAEEISLGILRHSNSWKMQLAALVIDSAISAEKIATCAEKITNKFLQKLESGEESKVHEHKEDYIKGIITQLSENISDMMYMRIVSITGKVSTTLPRIAYSGYKQYREKKADSKDIDLMKERIKEVNAAEKAAVGATCAHDAVAQTLGINAEQLAHASGMVPSAKGATKDEIISMYEGIGISTIECKESEAISKLKEMRSEHAVICLSKDDGGLGHSVSATLGKDGGLIIKDNGKQEPLESYLKENPVYKVSSIIVPEGITQASIDDGSLRRDINFLRIARRMDNVRLVGTEEGIKFGGRGRYTQGRKGRYHPSKNGSIYTQSPDKEFAHLTSDDKGRQEIYDRVPDSLPNAKEVNEYAKSILTGLQIMNRKDGLSGMVGVVILYDTEEKKYKIIPGASRACSSILTKIGSEFESSLRGVKKVPIDSHMVRDFLEKSESGTYTSVTGSTLKYESKRNKACAASFMLGVVGEQFGSAIMENPGRYRLFMKEAGGFSPVTGRARYPIGQTALHCLDCQKRIALQTRVKKIAGNIDKIELREVAIEYWFDYSPEAVHSLLELRLQSTDIDYLSNTKIIKAKQTDLCQSLDLLTKKQLIALCKEINVIYTNDGIKNILIPILIPQSELIDHWVGLAIRKQDGVLYVSYLDSENNPISSSVQNFLLMQLVKLLPQFKILFKQEEVENQRYNNCGLELIENFVHLLTGDRVGQEDSPYLNSELWVQKLIMDDIIQRKTAHDINNMKEVIPERTWASRISAESETKSDARSL